ncbi:MAG: hypothetical protein HOP30_04955 [Cyclobacteriaceae bacterium]|nr:hypothetical protein [Cyclobacteriaceae bacterium]
MEYVFNNRPSQNPLTILLSEFNMSVQHKGDEQLVAYASITALRLTKSNTAYQAIISIDGSNDIEVSNLLYHTDGKIEDRSRQYETFIRVLHFHLKEKSATRFVAGCSWVKAIGAILAAILFSIGISYGLDWMKLSFVDPFTMSLLFSALTLGFLIATFWPSLPKRYNPTEIPSQFIP